MNQPGINTPLQRGRRSNVPSPVAGGPFVRRPGQLGPRDIDFDRGRRFLATGGGGRDDDFRFVFDLGGGNVWIGDDPVWAPRDYWTKHRRRGYRRYWFPQTAYFPGTAYVATWPNGSSYNNSWPYFPVGDGYADMYGDPLGPAMVQAAQLTAPQPPRELTPSERAGYALRAGDAAGAVTILQEHTRTNPDDTDAIRRLAVALLESGEPEKAVAVMAMAYDKDPTLATRPLAAPDLFRDADRLRSAIGRAVSHANRVDTASAWLTVAALMQAQGRNDNARRMLERAVARGLPERTASAMRAALVG